MYFYEEEKNIFCLGFVNAGQIFIMSEDLCQFRGFTRLTMDITANHPHIQGRTPSLYNLLKFQKIGCTKMEKIR